MYKEPTISFEWITPERAKQFLERGDNRRIITPAKVEQYTRDMLSGNWTIADSCIMFDSEGKMHNGQHRCWAIIRSGRPILSGVMYGVTDEGTDHGLPRTISQVYQDITKNAAAIARAIIRIETKVSPSFAEVSRFIDKHREAISFVLEQFKTSKVGLRRAAVLAAITRAYYHMPKETLEKFIHTLYKGTSTSSSEDVIIMLRDTLLNKKGGGTFEQGQDYGKTERALWAYWQNENISRLYAPNKELFPFPEKR